MATPGLTTQPSATTYELEELVDAAWRGQIRVPHFQREFRWNRTDVVRLFDSIIKGYPIGSLLFWVRNSPPEAIRLGKLHIDSPGGTETLWVVDGQQRITSLANALSPVGNLLEPFSISYDLIAKEFIATPASPNPTDIPLYVLFDLEELLTWFSRDGSIVSEYFSEASRVARLIRQFKIPAYLVRQDNVEMLTDVFDRMNNYGKRLSRAEIFSALFAGPEDSANQRLSIPQIADRVSSETGFGNIDSNTVLHAILARRGPDPTRDIRIEFDDAARRTLPDFPGESLEVAYAEGEKALIRAINFLQGVAGVPHRSLLTYKALLVALTRFFAHFPNPRARNISLLRRAYWRVSVSGPAVFKGSFTQMSHGLCALIIPGEEDMSVRGLVRTMDEAGPTLPNPERFRTNEAVAKIIVCSWWGLHPRSPITGRRYVETDLTTLLGDQSTPAKATPEFFDRGIKGRQRLWAANRFLLPTEDESVEDFIDSLIDPPLEMDRVTRERVLKSHCLTEDLVALLTNGDSQGFLEKRQEMVTQQLKRFLALMAEWEYEDTPPLANLDLDDLDDEDDDSI